MNKKTYFKPTMNVVPMQHQGILCASDQRSVSVKSLSSDENLVWQEGGILDEEEEDF